MNEEQQLQLKRYEYAIFVRTLAKKYDTVLDWLHGRGGTRESWVMLLTKDEKYKHESLYRRLLVAESNYHKIYPNVNFYENIAP